MSDQLQASIPVATLKVAGTAVPDIEQDLEEIVIDTSYNLPAMATIRVHDHELEWIKDSTFSIGKEISIILGAPESLDAVAPAEVFAGEIVALEPHFTSQGNHSLTIRAYDRSHRLHLGTRSRTFLKMTDDAIVKKLAQEAGLEANADATKITYEYVLQNNMTDMEFLAARAQRIGYHFSVTGKKLNFIKAGSPVQGPILTLGENLRELSMRMSSARQSDRYLVRGWDFRAKKDILGSAGAQVAWRENGESKAGGTLAASAFKSSKVELVTLAPQTADEATALAKSAAGDQEGNFTEADGVAYGHPKLVAGVAVEMKELGPRFSGKYYVTSATHIFNSAGYDVHFTIAGRYPQTFNRLLNSGHQGAGEAGSMHGVVIGIVTNVKDPENLGRVKVAFPWLQDNGKQVESNWARIAMPSAGASRGMFFLPEVNDELLVAFEHGNANYPYVVGALWNGKDKPPETSAKAHTGEGTVQRIIASRLDHRIVFDDSKGAKSILIEDTTKSQSILIDSNKKSITVKAAGDLLIDVKGNIDIKSGGNINIEAVGNIKAEGVNVDVNAKSNATVDAKAVLGLKGTTSASLESPAATAVKGGATELSATGTTTISGLLVKIN
ncbi:MAG: VgrG-related protein [Caldilineaceae bacterium]|nr:VgrG-related protein [Caldilineaceae bacterium]